MEENIKDTMKNDEIEDVIVNGVTWSYTKIFNLPIKDKLLDSYDINMYLALSFFSDIKTGKAFPKRSALFEMAHCKRLRGDKSIRNLVKAGYIKKQERYNKHGGQNSNIYTIVDVTYIENILSYAKKNKKNDLYKAVKARLKVHPIPDIEEVINLYNKYSKLREEKEKRVKAIHNDNLSKEERTLFKNINDDDNIDIKNNNNASANISASVNNDINTKANNDINTDVNNKTNNDINAKANNKANKKKYKPKFDENSKPYELALLLRTLIENNNGKIALPDATPAGLEGWAIEIERLNRLGGMGNKESDNKGFSYNDIEKMINWTQSHEFWHTNILSAKKLRIQADKNIWIQMQQDKKPNSKKNNYNNKEFSYGFNTMSDEELISSGKYTKEELKAHRARFED